MNPVIDLRQGRRAPLNFVGLFKKWSWIVIVFAALIQCVFFFSAANCFAVAVVLVAWKITLRCIVSDKNFIQYSLSSFLILGFSITQYYIPAFFTLLEGKPVVFNLKFPYLVFTHSLLALLVMIVVHLLHTAHFKNTNRLRKSAQHILSKLGLFISPANGQIWTMGLIGLTAMFITYFFSKYSYENLSQGVMNKFIEGLIPFAFAPYYILIRKMFGRAKPAGRFIFLQLVIFTLALLAIGVGGNSRSLLIIGPTGAILAYFLGLLAGKFRYRIFTLRNVAMMAAGLWIITGPLSDIGTAMIIVRGQRGSISKTDMLRETFRVYRDKQTMRLFKSAAIGNLAGWNESYFDNIFLARFSNPKFNDANLEQARYIGHTDPEMLKYSVSRLLVIFPQPVLSLFQLDVDKSVVTASSYGDFLFSRGEGGVSALGGFRTGQFAGTGMATFGWWYLLILAAGLFPVYFLLDLFVIYKINKPPSPPTMYVSVAGLLIITSVFMFLSLSSTSESVLNIFTFIFRGWFQIVLLYALIFYIARLLTEFISGRGVLKA